MPAGIDYTVIEPDQIDVIRFLWEQLRDHHAALQWKFAHEMDGMEFAERKKGWLQVEEESVLRIETAISAESRLVGYCVSKIDVAAIGQIDSLFVTPEFRRQGIACALVQHAMDWFDQMGVWRKRVDVADGNPGARVLYEKFGFLSRTITMQHVEG